MDIDEILKQLEIHRLENRISEEHLAEILGVSFSTVNRWFSGKTKPNKIQRYHIDKLLTKDQKALNEK
ncbi:MAG: hypothetical protein AUJ70_00355 [Candidatus Omnitrophica bacterium CG1_02_40_15]|nr:MAG: hypothetical protein AUJ70_00355 [Candidatus Omnitrophica bacterium CG1_02_40_15]